MNAHPLASLVGPLRYACERDFARLASVKNLKTAVATAVEAAQGSVSPEAIALLRGALLHVDDAQVETRKNALKQVIAALRSSGVALPPEIDGLGASRVQGPPGASAASPLKRSPRGAPKRASKAKKAANDPAASEEARLLSIAPRAGPLSLPLKSVSWRLNPRLIGILNKKGIHRVGDILFMIPRAYEDRRRLKMISQLRIGERGVTVATVRTAGEVPTRGGRRMFRAVLADASGSIAATYFQSGPWLKARFPIGKRLVLSGEVRASPSGREIPHPEIEPAEDLDAASSIHFNRIVPVYSGFERHEQRTFRELAHRICAEYAQYLEEPLPASLLQELGLVGLSEAILDIHFPGEEIALDDPHQTAGHQRLAFDELFFLQLGIAAKRQGMKVDPGYTFNTSAERLNRAKGTLPFTLTGAQARVAGEILKDMAAEEPMHRLLQGDVGSGKTAVAQVAAAIALQDGFQVAVMAPTEILADQHWRSFQRVLGPLGYKVGLITSAGTQKEKRLAREEVREGGVQIAVGTHALIQGEVEFKNLGFVVIDEQHRFGVIQRHALMNKGRRPDVLVMTATPIPRTLAMTLYGDLDLSVIDELPPGRTPILTKIYGEKARHLVYEAMTAQLKVGHQAYVVYPLVEESEKVDLADATQGAERVRALFPDYQVGLLHGRMKAEEKEAVMADFRDGKLQILVCTTVVEVGVDVPNASVMVIEAAERFGLSQLHQLRGRVGRGAAKSFCFLIAGYARSQDSFERLQVMERSTDGFVIAEKDLEIRGPGEFLGTRQSGLPELAVANLTRDGALLNEARERAREIIDRDPLLSDVEHRGLAKALEERWEGRLALARVG